jgi:hypothetical protein
MTRRRLVTFGSPALGAAAVATVGRVAHAFLSAAVSPSRTVVDQLSRAYRFLDSAWIAEGGRPWWLPAGIFVFRVRYLSDAREEDLVQIAVNLADGRIFRRLDEAIDRHGIVADPADAWPMMPELPVGNAYALARTELEQKLVSPLGLRRRELAARLARESGRATAYYDELIREREEQRAGLAADPTERAPIDARLAALRLEREGRLGELRGKYRLEAEVSLRSLLRLYLPRVVFAGRLMPGAEKRLVVVAWIRSSTPANPCAAGSAAARLRGGAAPSMLPRPPSDVHAWPGRLIPSRNLPDPVALPDPLARFMRERTHVRAPGAAWGRRDHFAGSEHSGGTRIGPMRRAGRHDGRRVRPRPTGAGGRRLPV